MGCSPEQVRGINRCGEGLEALGRATPLQFVHPVREVDRVQSDRGDGPKEQCVREIVDEGGGELLDAAKPGNIPLTGVERDFLQLGVAGEYRRSRLRPPPRQTRVSVGAISDESEEIGDRRRVNPEFRPDGCSVENFAFPSVELHDASSSDTLPEVFVGGADQDLLDPRVGVGDRCPCAEGVVGFEFDHGPHRDSHGPQCVLERVELAPEGRIDPFAGLVPGVEVIAKGLDHVVRGDGHVRGAVLDQVEHAPQHAPKGTGLAAVGRLMRRESEEIPEEFVGSVDKVHSHACSLRPFEAVVRRGRPRSSTSLGVGSERYVVAQEQDISADDDGMIPSLRRTVPAERIVAGMEADPHSAQMLLDRQLTILWASAGVGTLLGHDPASLAGQPSYEFVHPDDLPMILEVTQLATIDPESASRRQNESGVRQTVDVRVRSRDGWVLLTLRAVARFGDSELDAMFVMLTMPDAHRTLLEGMQSVASHAPLVDSLQILLRALSRSGDNETIGAFVDTDGRVVAVSAGVRVTEDPASLPWGALGLGRASWTVDVPFLASPDDRTIEPHHWTLHLLSANAVVHPVDAFVAQKLATLATLAIESANTRRRMFEMARTDELTGISNRRSFQESLAAIGGDEVVSALIIDLDRFKAVNDGYGHHIGDAALVAVARALVACLGPTDVAARLGGDEFAALVRGDRNCRDETVARVRARLNGVEVVGAEVTLIVSASVGAADHDGGDPLVALRRADEQLLRAKATIASPQSSRRGRRAFRDA